MKLLVGQSAAAENPAAIVEPTGNALLLAPIKIPSHGRKKSFDEAAAHVFQKYDKTFALLADHSGGSVALENKAET